MSIRVTFLPHFKHILEHHSPIYSSGTPWRNAFSVQYSSKTPYNSAFFPRASSCQANAARLFRQLSALLAARASLLKASSASYRSPTRWLSLYPGAVFTSSTTTMFWAHSEKMVVGVLRAAGWTSCLQCWNTGEGVNPRGARTQGSLNGNAHALESQVGLIFSGPISQFKRTGSSGEIIKVFI